MTDRDRLIELLKKQVGYTLPIFIATETIKIIADYLLANGVIVPTLNCGDRVWFIPKGLDEVCEATVVRVEYNYFTSLQEWIVLDYISS